MVAVAVVAVACDSGSPSKSRDDIAADSALASDLALANRDTLLVDSIGEYRPPDAAERDTAVRPDSVIVSSPSQSQVAPPAAALAPAAAPAVASGPTRKG
ncbi:MAG TPA: hypothetical protein VFC35_08885, partial [Gemmatimonadaceae bacterium]|nr:hypothetical protein [Gemmatimonadaceae bacterium]